MDLRTSITENFPLLGYVEIFYNDAVQAVSIVPLKWRKISVFIGFKIHEINDIINYGYKFFTKVKNLTMILVHNILLRMCFASCYTFRWWNCWKYRCTYWFITQSTEKLIDIRHICSVALFWSFGLCKYDGTRTCIFISCRKFIKLCIPMRARVIRVLYCELREF